MPSPCNLTKCMKMRALVLIALPEESVPVSLPGYETIPVITRVGKTRAAMETMRAVLQHRPHLVVNVGTAGTISLAAGDIIVSTHFIDRDFARLRLQGIGYEISLSCDLSAVLPSVIGGHEEWQGDRIVSTGDDFVTAADTTSPAGGSAWRADAIDMEAFAEATVCQEMGVPYISLKYITDVVGQNSVQAWADKLASAREDLAQYLERYLGR